MALEGTWRQEDAAAAAASKLHQAPTFEASSATLAGLATCSMAFTLAVRDPPAGLGKSTYLLAVTGAFFAGVAEVITAVSVSNNNPRARRAAGTELMYASIAPLAVVVGLSVATLLW